MVYRAPRHFSFVLLHYKNIKKIVNNSNELLLKIVCVFIIKSDLNTPHSLYYTTLKKTFYMVLYYQQNQLIFLQKSLFIRVMYALKLIVLTFKFLGSKN